MAGTLGSLLQNTVLIACSTLAALIVAEFSLRPVVPVIQLGPVFTTYSKDLGLINKRNLRCERITPEYHNLVTTNQFGLRGAPTTLSKPVGRKRILCVGDSFTFGKGVEDDETFCYRLERMLDHLGTPLSSIETLNAGVVSYGTSNELLYLRKQGFLFQPDLIILQFYANDFDDNLLNGLFALESDGSLVQTSEPYAKLKTALEIYQWIPFKDYLDYSRLFQLARIQINQYIFYYHQPQENAGIGADPGRQLSTKATVVAGERTSQYRLRLTAALLTELFSEVKRRDIPIILLTFDLKGHEKSIVEKTAGDNSIPTIDLGDLRTKHPEFYYAVDGHWRSNGHTYVAKEIFEFLEKNPTMLLSSAITSTTRGKVAKQQ